MTDTLTRIISDSGKVFGIACNTTELVNNACRRHDLGPTAAAALGRALTGAILLAGLMKDEQRVQLVFEGNGPLGKVIAEASSSGWSRGYVLSPRADVPLREGRIDVAAGIGNAGFLRVIKDIGMKEKYSGLVQLYTSEIGEDIAYYLTESEQTPSTVSLGVHLLPNGSVSAAGGFLIQTLPPADENIIQELESAINKQESITTQISSGVTPLEILTKLFVNIPHKVTGQTNLIFRCTCSKDTMEKVLTTLSSDDLEYLLEKDDGVDVKCDYCSDRYFFNSATLREILRNK